MKFAHIADAHLGAFSKNPPLRDLNVRAFEVAIEKSIEEKVDFILIAGDLFHNPIPDMDIVRRAVETLKMAVDEGIRIYAIYGSHDFSAGSTALLDVLASTGLFRKVVNYRVENELLQLEPVVDETGVSMVGISGLSSAQEIEYFEHLDRKQLESIPNPKIFVFHTTISELKPAYIPEKYALPKSMLPRGFDYYAGGHLHERIESHVDGAPLIYPGALFGATYNDLDIIKDRGFFIVEDFKQRYVSVKVCDFHKEMVKADGLSAKELEEKLLRISKQDFQGKVVILKVKGKLRSGNVGDIDFHKIRENIRGTAIDLLLNTYGLSSAERKTLNVVGETAQEIENEAFEKISKYGIETTRRVFEILKEKKQEGMTENDFLSKLTSEIYSVIDDMEKPKKDPEMKNRKENTKKGAKTLFEFGVGA